MARATTTPPPVLIRRPEVLRRCGISNTTLHRLIHAGEFPRPIQLGWRCVAWIEAEVDAWIEARIVASRGQGGMA
ncbi:AlpA family transcriptional regulator [Halomonas sp. 3H]|uniref:helix-turn-helix transcriptional regulator n=1 Tax=Halomonas sp. 3H TaxID=2952527 RepID=UPI0020B6529C|nr:AlpA family transcriptional regulator [Halomonas sp. 3H]